MNEKRQQYMESFVNEDEKNQDIKSKNLKNSETNSYFGKSVLVEETTDTFSQSVDMIKVQLEENKSTLDQNLFIDQLIPLLNQLNRGENFNKVLLMHIMEFGNLNKEEPILLKDFFKVYFNVYDNMKQNRNNLTKDLMKMVSKIEKIRNKINKYKGEILMENGLTSNSYFQFYLSKKDQNIENSVEKVKLIIENKGKSDSINLNFEDELLNKKNKLKISENDHFICTLSFLKYDENSKMWTKCLEDNFPNVVSDSYSINKYNLPNNINIELSYKFVPSKLNYYQRKLGENEFQTEELKKNIQIMDSSIYNLQKIFPKIFSNNEKINVENNPIEEVSEKIEQIVLNLVGKNIIMWERFLNILNKCVIIACILIMMMYRGDFITLIICTGILGIEYQTIQKSHYLLLLKCLLGSIICDILWTFYYIFNYRNLSLLEGEYSGSSYRKFTTILSGFIIIMKLIIFIALWRLTQLHSYNEMNPEIKKVVNEVKEEKIEERKSFKSKTGEKSKSSFRRPNAKINKVSKETTLGLRDLDLIEKI